MPGLAQGSPESRPLDKTAETAFTEEVVAVRLNLSRPGSGTPETGQQHRKTSRIGGNLSGDGSPSIMTSRNLIVLIASMRNSRAQAPGITRPEKTSQI